MNAVGASERIFKLMDRVAAIKLEGGETIKHVQGYIDFDNVSFRFNNSYL